MTRMTSGLAWLATEAVGEGELRVVVDMGVLPDKRELQSSQFQGSALSYGP
jgi:hypothetical protein